MRRRNNTFFDRLRKLDAPLMVSALMLTIYGIVVVSSATSYMNTNKLVIVQIAAAALGVCAMLTIALIDYNSLLKRLWIPIYIVSIALLLLPIAKSIPSMLRGNFGNNESWIALPFIGVNLQPAEIVKILFIMTFGYRLGRLRANGDINSFKSIMTICLHGGVMIFFVLLEMDLGAVISFLIIFFTMCFVAGVSLWYFLAAGVVVVAASPILWRFMSEYQQMRILVGFDPYLDPDGYGYQVIQSMKAIANGGITGSGYGSGPVTQSLSPSTLPARHTDMIFAPMCEEFGFVGALVFFVLIIVVVVRILVTARRANNTYGSYICAGVAAVLIFQTIENVGMCLGLLPVIGITLPFISYGGSSIVSVFLCIGAVMSVRTHSERGGLELNRREK